MLIKKESLVHPVLLTVLLEGGKTLSELSHRVDKLAVLPLTIKLFRNIPHRRAT